MRRFRGAHLLYYSGGPLAIGATLLFLEVAWEQLGRWAGYLGHLAHEVFHDLLIFPFALTFIGLATIGAGVAWQRNEPRIEAQLQRFRPRRLGQALAARGQAGPD